VFRIVRKLHAEQPAAVLQPIATGEKD